MINPGEDTNNQFFHLCFQVSESRLYLFFVFICGLYLGCRPLLCCLILVVSVYRVLEEI